MIRYVNSIVWFQSIVLRLPSSLSYAHMWVWVCTVVSDRGIAGMETAQASLQMDQPLRTSISPRTTNP